MPENDRIDALVANRSGDIKQLLSRDRYKTLAMVIILVMVGVAGCEMLHPPTVPSPLTGKPVNAQQLEAERAQYELDIKARSSQAEAEYKTRMAAIDVDAQKHGVAFKSSADEIVAKHDRNLSLFNAAGSALGAIPGYGDVAAAIFGLGALFYAGGAKADQMRAGSIIANRPLISPVVRTGEPDA